MNTRKDLIDRYGKLALVTGASSGIGKAFSYRLASLGFNIIITARRIERLNQIKKDLETSYNIEVIPVTADLSALEGNKIVADIIRQKNIGLFVANAGIGKIGPLYSNSNQLIEQMINLNCVSSARLIKDASSQMLGRKRGAIINVSSVMAKLPLSYAALYSGTKAFNLAFGEAIYNELKESGIDVLTILPGSTKTEFDGFGNKIKESKQRTADQVVKTSLKALGKKPVIVDGIKNKIIVVLSKLVSNSIRLKITGIVSKKYFLKAESNNPS